jgi:two-component system, NtrC family, sensor histidine kinase HydH
MRGWCSLNRRQGHRLRPALGPAVDVLAVSALLASLVTLAIGLSVLLRDRTRRTYTSFAAFAFVVAAWHLCKFIAMATEEPLAEWLALWPAATIPPTALRFFREFLAEPSIGGKRRPPRVTLFWTIIAYLALIYSAIFQPIHTEAWFQVPFAIYVFAGLYRCVYDLYVQYRATITRVERTRIRYLMLGGFVATTLALTDVLPFFDTAWPAIGNVLTILYLYFLSQTLFRYRLLDLNELVGKMAVLGTLVVLLWAVYGLLLAWVGGGQEGLFLLNALVASFVILILFEPVRNRLENVVNRWLVRQRHELRGRLHGLRRELANVVDVGEMVRRIVAALEESRRVTHASVYLIDADGTGYDLAGSYGTAPVERIDAAARRAFLDRLREGYIDSETLKRELHDLETRSPAQAATTKEHVEQLQTVLDEMQTSLVVPILGAPDDSHGAWLLGMLAARDERMEGAFDLDDIDMFRQLATQAARTIEATQVYERVKERDRLAAIGEMAAGLAHEIRNPLGAIKGAAQLLVGPDGKPIESADTAEFLTIIVEEVDRLNQVVTQFLQYARPDRGERAPHVRVDVHDVLRKTVQLLDTTAAEAGVELIVDLADELPAVLGAPEQLHQVFLNLGLNAVQAMESGGTLEIASAPRRRSRLGYGSFAEIRFRDTGVGIPRDRLRNLFIPFYTTKERGSGLGLAICERIVNQHGGAIEVRSEPGRGSTFSVILPAVAVDERDQDPPASVAMNLSRYRVPASPETAAAQAASEEPETGATESGAPPPGPPDPE